MWDFVRSGFSIVKQFHSLSSFPIANMSFVLLMVPEPYFSKVAENCIAADILAECGVVCIWKEQLDHYFVRNTQ